MTQALEKKPTGRLSRADKMRMAQQQNAADYANQIPVLSEKVLEGELITSMDTRLIDKNPFQNRRRFSQESIIELADQILANGQQQPIGVRKVGSRYQIIFGERRWRACQLLPGKMIDVVIRDATDVDMAYNCYAENAGREKIHDYEKSCAIRMLLDMGREKDEIMERLVMKKQDYYKTLKFMSLPSGITEFLDDNPEALGRNEAVDIERIYSEFGSEVPDNFVEEVVSLLQQYINGKISSRSQIIKEIKEKFTTPKTRNREKVNQESALFYSDSRVGEMIDTPKELRMVFSKSEMPKDVLDELKGLISKFLANVDTEDGSTSG